MLEQMLRLLNSGGLYTTEELARRLGVSTSMVAAMAENLVRRGYLVSAAGGCAAACGSCLVAGTCGPHCDPVTSPRLLALTGKGRALAGRA